MWNYIQKILERKFSSGVAHFDAGLYKRTFEETHFAQKNVIVFLLEWL